jgi:hypothetical protein
VRVEVDLPVAEGQRPAAPAEDDHFHPRHPGVEGAGSLHVGDGPDEVVERMGLRRTGG